MSAAGHLSMPRAGLVALDVQPHRLVSPAVVSAALAAARLPRTVLAPAGQAASEV